MTPRIINDWKGPKAVARPALRSDVMTGPSRPKVAGPNELDAFQGELLAKGVTVSVLAAFLGVIRGLFPGKDKEDKSVA